MKNELQHNPVTTLAPTESTAGWFQTHAILRFIFIICLTATILWIVYRLRGVLLLLILAVFFAYFLAPLVDFLQRPLRWRGRARRLPRTLAIGLVYLLVIGLIVTALYALLPRIGNQLVEMSQQSPAYWAAFRTRTQGLMQWYDRAQLPPAIRDAINQAATRTVELAGGYVSSALTQVAGWLTYLPWLVLIPILAFFLLKDSTSLRRAALQILPRGTLRWRGHKFFEEVNYTLAVYIRGQLSACLIISIICMIGFEVLRVPYALVLGVLAGFLEFIPLVGPFALLVAAVVIACFASLSKGVEVAGFLLVLRALEDYVIYPRLIGSSIDLHPLVIILAVLCGGELGGIIGIFLAIPTVAILAAAYRHWLEFKGSDGMIGDLLQPRQENTALPSAPVQESSS